MNGPAAAIHPELSRRERRKLEIRNRIVDSALALFDRNGVEATTVTEIRTAADVAHKTFFNYFPTRQHLLRAIAEESLTEFLAVIAEARSRTGNAGSRLMWLFDRIAERCIEAGPLHRELLLALIHVAHTSGRESEQARALHAAFREIIADGVRDGDLSPRQGIETAVEVVLGSFYALMFSWAHLDAYPLRESARDVAAFLYDAMATSSGSACD